MTRFSLDYSSASAPESTQGSAERWVSPRPHPSSVLKDRSSSLRWVCASPAEKVCYAIQHSPTGINQSLVYTLECRGVNNNDTDGNAVEAFQLTSTRFPPDVQEVLHSDPPLELLCIEGDGFESEFENEFENGVRKETDGIVEGDTSINRPANYPRFVMYCSTHVYLLQLEWNRNSNDSMEMTLSCRPLLEEILCDFATCVVRIRPAPQRCAGHAVYAPGGSCVVLLRDTDACNYQLRALQVGRGYVRGGLSSRSSSALKQATVSHKVALSFCVEATPGEAVVDFSFGLSSGNLAALSSLSVLLVKESGDVCGASPIVLDGTIVPQDRLQESMDALDFLLENVLDRAKDGPRRRQVLAVRRYLQDVFLGGGEGRGLANSRSPQFAQAQLANAEASTWTVQLQGPIILGTQNVEQDDAALLPALVVEALTAGDYGGLVVGRSLSSGGGRCDWAVYSPVFLLPRFAMESPADRLHIDTSIIQHSNWVDRVELGYPTILGGEAQFSAGQQPPQMHLLGDPLSDHLLHVVVPAGIYTVSTNVLNVICQCLRASTTSSQDNPASVRTTAWGSLATIASNPVCGAVVLSGSAGHALLGRLADEFAQAVHITEQEYRHELETMFPATPSPGLTSSAASTAVQQMEKTLPHHEVVGDLLTRLRQGLDGMQKLTGSTRPEDISAELAALCVSIGEHCDQNVVVPLLELKGLNKIRWEAIFGMVDSLQEQSNTLSQQQEDLEIRCKHNHDRLKRTEANMSYMAERSSRVLANLEAMAPTMTKAEVEFGNFCQRSTTKVDHLAKKVHSMTEKRHKLQAQGDGPSRPENTRLDQHLKKIAVAMEFRSTEIRQRYFEVDKTLRALRQPFGIGD